MVIHATYFVCAARLKEFVCIACIAREICFSDKVAFYIEKYSVNV